MIEKSDLEEYLEILEKNRPISIRVFSKLAYSATIFVAVFLVYSFYAISSEFSSLKKKNALLEEKLASTENHLSMINADVSDLSNLLKNKELEMNALSKQASEINNQMSLLQYAAKGDIEDLKDLFDRVKTLESSVDNFSNLVPSGSVMKMKTDFLLEENDVDVAH